MTEPRGGPSYWISSTPETSYPALEHPVEVDVAVIGAGITGITAATRLKEAGKTVALVEARRALHGVTGYTTAKLTAGHGIIYSYLERAFGADAARLYASANTAAVEEVARVVAERGIDCDLERTRNVVYTERTDDVPRLEAEVAAARRAGLPAHVIRETELPFAIAGAYVLDDQAQFHPRKYLLPLLALIPGDGSHVFERSRIVAVEAGARCRVRTSGGGEAVARDVVVATHMPILDRGLFFAKVHPMRSYAVAGAVAPERAPREMHISVGRPTRSIRSVRDGERRLLLVGGEGHKTGQEPRTPDRYARLEEWARERFGLERVEQRWSTQDNFSVDRLPYAGRLVRRSDHILVATGFGGWGLSNGTATGMLLADLLLGRDNPWAELYDAKRLKPRAAAADFAKENANVAARWLGDRAAAARRREVGDLLPGEGRVARVAGELVAVHRDHAGELHAVSAVCTHLGCVVGWNAAERSWDCPCHGSRFDAGGTVVQGPAVRDLARREDVLRRR